MQAVRKQLKREQPPSIVRENHWAFLSNLFDEHHHASVNSRLFNEKNPVVLINDPKRMHAIGVQVTKPQLPYSAQKVRLGPGEIFVRVGVDNPEAKQKILERKFPAYAPAPEGWNRLAKQEPATSHVVVAHPEKPMFVRLRIGKDNSVKLVSMH